MAGIHLNKKIGIIGGGITGLVIGIFLARAGHNVSIFEKKSLLSETSSKTTKLLHGGLRYLENFHFQEVKNGLNDRFWWLENFPKHTNKIKISIPFRQFFSIKFLKLYLGIKLYESLSGSKSLGKSSLTKTINSNNPQLKENYIRCLTFYDGVMDDYLLGKDLIILAKELNINIYEDTEVSNFDINGKIDSYSFDKVILAAGPWSKILLDKNQIKSEKDIDFIKGSHIILKRKLNSGYMFSGICKSRYVFALPYKDFTLVGTTEERAESPENPSISLNEKKYLIDSYNKILKDPISYDEIDSSYSGVRPLIKSKNNFHNSSRDFYIQQDKSLISIFGGKWTTSPSIARKIATII